MAAPGGGLDLGNYAITKVGDNQRPRFLSLFGLTGSRALTVPERLLLVPASSRLPIFIGSIAPAAFFVPPPGVFLDSALGTFDVENVLKERMHVQPEETRCRGVRRSPEGD